MKEHYHMSIDYQSETLSREAIRTNVNAIDYASAPLGPDHIEHGENFLATVDAECDWLIDAINTLRELVHAGRADVAGVVGSNTYSALDKLETLIIGWGGREASLSFVNEDGSATARGHAVFEAGQKVMATSTARLEAMHATMVPELLNTLSGKLKKHYGTDNLSEMLGQAAKSMLKYDNADPDTQAAIDSSIAHYFGGPAAA